MNKILLALTLFSLLPNLGFAQFSEANNFSWQGENINQLHIGDTEGDGDLDYIISNITTGPRFIENNGSNLYEYPVFITTEEFDHTESEMADFDSDGDLDFISLRPTLGTITLFTNAGDNTFTQTIVYDSDGETLRHLASEDIDADGLPDLTMRQTFNTLVNLKNNGDGTFTPEIIVDDATNIEMHHQFDGDGDGDLDIAYFENMGNIYYCENLGIDYSDAVYITAASSLTAMQSMDYDEDGDIDLIYSTPAGSAVKMVENLGDGTFATPVIIAGFVAPVVEKSVDLDNDGKLDILVNDYIGGTDMNWMRNLGGGAFADLEPISSLEGAGSGEFLDYDLDGDLDLIQIMHTGTIAYFENTGGVEFAKMDYISETTIAPIYSFTMDVDNDGDEEIFCCSANDHKISWVDNQGEGHYSRLKVAISTPLFSPTHATAADIDGDGFMDIIATSHSESIVSWYKNMGDGTFDEGILFTASQLHPNFVLSEDWDADGDNDIIVASKSDLEIMLFENIDGSISPLGSLILDGVALQSMNSADMDNDGDLDILYSTDYSDNIAWLENTGDLAFTNYIIAEDITGTEATSVTDMDEDGDLDVLFPSPLTGEILWIENLGLGIFGDILGLISGCEEPVIALYEDINNDGQKDIFVASKEDETIGFYENIGDLEFDDLTVISDEQAWVKNILAEDLDQDGDKDIVSISAVDWQFAWFENMHFTEHSTKGTIFIDFNENGIQDVEDEGVNFAVAGASPESYFAFTSASGNYTIAYDETEFGDYTIYPQILEFWGISTVPSYDVTIDGAFTLYEDLDFGIYPSELVDHVEPTLTGGFPRINNEVTYSLNYSNIGTTTPSGTLHLQLDEAIAFVGANAPPALVDGQDIYWSYEDLYYFEDAEIQVTVLMPNFESIGLDIKSYFTLEVEDLGEVVFTSMDSLDQVIQGAYDPNDKSARPAGTTEYGYIAPETETLEYLVRFQNTGTDTAFLVIIEDQLDPNLDWSSLRPLAWSHDMEIEANHDGLISFVFNDIMLPDSNANQLASNGFVKYEIDLLPGLPLETSIYNTAHIFFDANPAVITNTTVNTLHVDDDSGVSENNDSHITVYPNPFSDFTTVKFSEEFTGEHTIIIYDILGTEVYRLANISGQQVQIGKNDIGSGLYFLSVVNPDGRAILTTKLFAE
ncbi:MAG: T9SS type A sorting domain-containing protein [Crocinitomix sp.]|nr:T9SS type A sorting domain-containing protein [Crocinitomix sp.]